MHAESQKGSFIAVDAGAHLASIVRILEESGMPPNSAVKQEQGKKTTMAKGPFAGIRFPNISAKANALWMFRHMVHSFLITHAHIDHLSGIAINTPALEYGREAKAIVALPSIIEAIKTHIFNDSIWPNLSDEDHGVGFVTYRRLIEGGNPRLGQGNARGYVNVCDGLSTKCWSVSHGKCRRRNQSMSASAMRGDSFGFPGSQGDPFASAFGHRRQSQISDGSGYMQAIQQHHAHHAAINPHPHPSMIPPGTPSASMNHTPVDRDHNFEPVESSAFFIRCDETGREILIFGDLEPDTVSMHPRNHIVWNDAASKFVDGKLSAIFIECSYDDSTRNEDLYGHLCPRHLIAELAYLAHRVMALRTQDKTALELQDTASLEGRQKRSSKRKRGNTPGAEAKVNGVGSPTGKGPNTKPIDDPLSPTATTKMPVPKQRRKADTPSPLIEGQPIPGSPGMIAATAMPGSHGGHQFPFPHSGNPTHHTREMQPPLSLNMPGQQPTTHHWAPPSVPKGLPKPLKGVDVHIIHVKDTMLDGPTAGDIILEEVREHEKEVQLGCEFSVTFNGESVWA